MAREKVWARRPFEYAGRELDRGQVTELVGALNDEKLQRLGYVDLVPKGAGVHECRGCNGRFMDAGLRDAHGKKRHPQRSRTLTPLEEDAAMEREEKVLASEAPLNLDQTAASRKG